MCLLTVFSPDAAIDHERMRNAADNNPDGFGFAMLLDGHIARFRSMSYMETITEFAEQREKNADCWALFHHRFSTGGGTTTDNCHPFTWSHDERLAIAHNGVLPVRPGRRKSDTRIWAEHMLADFDPTVLDDDEWWTKTETWMGTSKAVFLSSHPDTKYGLYIMNENLGHWEDGVWWSNRSYQSWRSSRSGVFSGITSAMSAPSTTDAWNATTISCGNCAAAWDALDDFSETNCPDCGFCWICGEASEHCMCWVPTVHSSNADMLSLDDHYRMIAELSLGSDGP